MHWHRTSDVDSTPTPTHIPTATSLDPTHKQHEGSGGIGDDDMMTENVMMSVWDSRNPSNNSRGNGKGRWSSQHAYVPYLYTHIHTH